MSNKVENISFDVIFDNNPCKKTKSRISKRLSSNDDRISAEELGRKQQQADIRRQAQKDAKLARIKQRQDQCKRIAVKMEALLELDAKRKGVPGTESTPVVSRRQAADMIRSFADDFQKIGKSLSNDVITTDC